MNLILAFDCIIQYNLYNLHSAMAVRYLITTQEWSTSSQIRYQMDRARMVQQTREAVDFEILTYQRTRIFFTLY